MSLAAVPKYLPDSLRDAAPGHRFNLYCPLWQVGSWQINKSDKTPALKSCTALGDASKAQIAALRTRQQALISHYGTSGYRTSTTSTAPFATGLGNEHPIENGFAFLTPYGLPYLAGSGVKGILRHAAEELVLENEAQDPQGWRWVDVWWLFGFEGSCGKADKGSVWDANSPLGQAFARDLDKTATDPDLYPLIRNLIAGDKKLLPYTDTAQDGAHQFLHACLAGRSLRGGLQARGALDFWDVFPNPADGKLVVEIMTPHFGNYYDPKKGEAPHDSGAPIPVSFLAVPARSQFDFHVVCQPTRLPEALQNQWRALLDRAFRHAFEWVGFGAKTSVGYGAMQPASKSATSSGSSSASAATNSQGPASNIVNTTETWPAAHVKFNRANGTLTAENSGAHAHAIAPQGEALLNALPLAIQSKIRRNEFTKVKALVTGNTLVKLEV